MDEVLFTGVWVTPNTYTIAKSHPIIDGTSWKLYHKSLHVNSQLALILLLLLSYSCLLPSCSVFLLPAPPTPTWLWPASASLLFSLCTINALKPKKKKTHFLGKFHTYCSYIISASLLWLLFYTSPLPSQLHNLFDNNYCYIPIYQYILMSPINVAHIHRFRENHLGWDWITY